MQVYYRDWGVADTILGQNQAFIEVNSNLKKYHYAYTKTLKHEREHLLSKGKFDFLIEIKQLFDLKLAWQLLKFHLRYPKAFYQYLPFSKTIKGHYAVNPLYSLVLLLVVGVALW